MNGRIWRAAAWAAVAVTLTGLVAFPREVSAAVSDSLTLCVGVLVPSLFPFFVLAGLFVGTGLVSAIGRGLSPLMRPLFRVPGAAAAAFVLGLVSGYPVGASMTVELYRTGQCSKAEAERLLAFCNNAGPMFVLSAVGVGIWGRPQLGVLLYACHVLAALMVGFAFRFRRGRSDKAAVTRPAAMPPVRQGFGRVFVDSVRGGAMSTLHVIGFVCFFGVLIRLMDVSGAIPVAARALGAFGMPYDWTRAALSGFMEVTAGVHLAGALPTAAGLTLTAALLGWAGLSVHGQAMSFIAGSGLSAKPYVLGKALQGLLAATLTAIALTLFPQAVTAFAPGAVYAPDMIYAYMPTKQAALALWCVAGALCALLGIVYAIVTLFEKRASNRRRSNV